MKLAGMLGLYLGWPKVWYMIFLASGLGAFIGIGLILVGKIKRREPIPFGPFMAVAAMILYLWGENIILWYAAFFK